MRSATSGSRHLHVILSIAMLATAFVVLVPGTASAAVFNVDSTQDRVDANPGDGDCATGQTPPKCTLRAAVMEANALAGADEVVLDSNDYLLTRVGVQEDAAETGDLDVTEDLTVSGEDEAETFIDGRKL